MAGVKGKSGRKSWDKEAQSKELWNLSIPVLKHVLLSNDPELKFRKIEIALVLVSKMLPQEHEHTGDISFHFNLNGIAANSERQYASRN